MRMSARRIRAINHAVARANGIICGASDTPRRLTQSVPALPTNGVPAHTVRIVAVPPPQNA